MPKISPKFELEPAGAVTPPPATVRLDEVIGIPAMDPLEMMALNDLNCLPASVDPGYPEGYPDPAILIEPSVIDVKVAALESYAPIATAIIIKKLKEFFLKFFKGRPKLKKKLNIKVFLHLRPTNIEPSLQVLQVLAWLIQVSHLPVQDSQGNPFPFFIPEKNLLLHYVQASAERQVVHPYLHGLQEPLYK